MMMSSSRSEIEIAQPELLIRTIGKQSYLKTLKQMQAFMISRDHNSLSEFWLLEHPQVYTLGQAAKKEHLLQTRDIPVIQSDRGGQVTYHGPGQLIVYMLLNLKEIGIGIKSLVHKTEAAIICTLADAGIIGTRYRHAPGVYVNKAKIAALGLRVKKHCTYHGLSLNIDMDLEPYKGINPCGYEHLKVTDMRHQGSTLSFAQVAGNLCHHLSEILGYQIKTHV